MKHLEIELLQYLNFTLCFDCVVPQFLLIFRLQFSSFRVRFGLRVGLQLGYKHEGIRWRSVLDLFTIRI